MLALLMAGLFGGLVASASADLPQLPPIPPAPRIPTLPLLPAPTQVPHVAQVAVPKVPKIPDAPPISHPSLPAQPAGAPAGTSQSSTRVGQRSGTPTRSSTAAPTKVYSLHFSKDWIARSGPEQGRQTILTFVLRRPLLVEFVVFQLAPDCKRMGRFRVQGRPGMNRVRFRGRFGRRVLEPGTYRIKASVLPGRRTVAEKRLVVVSRVNKEDIAAARGADACAAGRGENTSLKSFAARSSGATGRGSSPQASTTGRPTSKPRPARRHGVLGTRFTKQAVDAVKRIPLWLFVLLGLAIALLAVAALPLRVAPNGRTAAVLAHRRGLIALVGAAMLVAVTVAYALS